MNYKVAKEFTNCPGGRYINDGSFSGEELRDNVLKGLLDECIKKNEKLYIDLDGGYGYPRSFLEETFGGLVRAGYDKKVVLKTIEIISDDEPKLIETIQSYIKEA